MSGITLYQQAANPSVPSAGACMIFPKTDDRLYWIEDDGDVHKLAHSAEAESFTTIVATAGATVGTASAGSSTFALTLIGGSGSGGGPYIEFYKNLTNKGFIGVDSAVNGGTSDDITIRAVSGQSVNLNIAGTHYLTTTATGTVVSASDYKVVTVAKTNSNGAGVFFKNYSSTVQYNWLAAVSYNGTDTFELIPTTAANGTTISGTSAFTVTRQGNGNFIGTLSSTGSATHGNGSASVGLTINGATSSGNGPFMTWSANSVAKVQMGLYGGLHGSTNMDDFEISGAAKILMTTGSSLAVTGYIKASNNGAYAGAGSSYHELYTTASGITALLTNTHASTPNGMQIEWSGAAPNNTTQHFIYCDDTGGLRMQVRSNGGIANYSANNVNLSDSSQKIIYPMQSFFDEWERLEWQKYMLIDQTHTDFNFGIDAVQLYDVFHEKNPGLVTMFADGKLGYHEHDFINMGLGVLTEAVKRIKQLEARLDQAGIPTYH